jgi:hypothetical protein
VLNRPNALAGRPGHVDPVRQVAEDRDAEAPALLLRGVEDLARDQGRLDEVGAEVVVPALKGVSTVPGMASSRGAPAGTSVPAARSRSIR